MIYFLPRSSLEDILNSVVTKQLQLVLISCIFFNHRVEINRNQKLFEIKLLGGHSGRSPHPVLGFLSSLWETLCSVAPPGGG